MVFRGFNSATLLHTLGEEIQEDGRPAYIYYFGDWDPSGKDIQRYAMGEVREHAPDADITFEGIAVTPQQIAA
jgi:hypothetical protein